MGELQKRRPPDSREISSAHYPVNNYSFGEINLPSSQPTLSYRVGIVDIAKVRTQKSPTENLGEGGKLMANLWSTSRWSGQLL
jgi:hypothetical protein